MGIRDDLLLLPQAKQSTAVLMWLAVTADHKPRATYVEEVVSGADAIIAADEAGSGRWLYIQDKGR